MRVWLAVVIFACAPGVAEACNCGSPGMPCSALDRTAAVFVGRATEITDARDPSGASERVVRFEVTESFKGPSSRTLEVRTGSGGTDCGFPFAAGRDYLVYAAGARPGGPLTASICSRTRALADARADLEYLRGAGRRTAGHGIVGQVARLRRVPPNSTNTVWDGPLADARVVVTRAGRRWETRTDAGGEFEVWGLAPGVYQVVVSTPAGFVGGEAQPVELQSAATCSEVRVLVLPAFR